MPWTFYLDLYLHLTVVFSSAPCLFHIVLLLGFDCPPPPLPWSAVLNPVRLFGVFLVLCARGVGTLRKLVVPSVPVGQRQVAAPVPNLPGGRADRGLDAERW